MGQKHLIDTNSLIDAQAMKLPQKGLAFLADAIDEDFTVSFITYIEFLGYKDATQDNKDFIELAAVIDINKAIIDTCIELRKTHHIKLRCHNCLYGFSLQSYHYYQQRKRF